MVDAQLDALAVETRRAIYTMLLEGPRSVGDIAVGLPVSRPAVSQHLKVLLEADLARVNSIGNRRVYSANPKGMAALREWMDELWEMAMAGFAGFANEQLEVEMVEGEGLDPLVKMVTVPGSVQHVFELFTSRIGEWWPRVTHSVGGDEALTVHMGPGSGARVYETTADGQEHEWGTILDWDPPQRVAFSWHPGIPVEQSTHVEITFRTTPGGTEVTLVHDGWEARGADGQQMRDNYDTGWDLVLGRVPGSRPIGASTAR